MGKSKIPFKERLLSAAFVLVIAIGFLGAGLMLVASSQLVLTREADGVHAKLTTHFLSWTILQRTMGPIERVFIGDDYRDRTTDSLREKERQRSRRHVEMVAKSNARLTWNREDDYTKINGFLSAREPSLTLRNDPGGLRGIGGWGLFGFGVLCLGGVVNCLLGVQTTGYVPPSRGPKGRLP